MSQPILRSRSGEFPATMYENAWSSGMVWNATACCRVQHPESGVYCTRPVGHGGEHAAHVWSHNGHAEEDTYIGHIWTTIPSCYEVDGGL